MAPCTRGFTLVELLVVMSCAGILLGLAVPSMRQFMQNQRLSSAAASLITALNYARSEAVKEDLPSTVGVGGVEVCASADGVNCDVAGNWNNGWIVLSAANAVPLQVSGPLPTGMTVSQNSAMPAVIFQSSGMLPTGALVVPQLEFKFCDTRGAAFAREVEVNATGYVAGSPTPGFDVAQVALACP
jgi:type IV fimbrial biogenesis protein FimT